MLRRQSRRKIYLIIYLPTPIEYALHTEYLSQYEIDIYLSSDKHSTINFIRDNDVAALLMIKDNDHNEALSFLRYIMRQYPNVQRILLSTVISTEYIEEVVNKAHINYFLTLPVDKDRMLEIVRKAFRRYLTVSKPAEMIDELTEYVRQFREDANTDSLTKLLNRRTFDEVMQRAIELFREKKIPISLIMLDIDFFKKLNDTYGHSAGDEVLRQFSSILKKNIRVEDSVFRYGGEEFAIVAHGNTKDDIKLFTERILAEVQSTVIKYEEKEIKFTFSAGIESMKSGLNRKTLIQRADAALYHAKNSGRNRVVCYEDYMLSKLK